MAQFTRLLAVNGPELQVGQQTFKACQPEFQALRQALGPPAIIGKGFFTRSIASGTPYVRTTSGKFDTCTDGPESATECLEHFQ